MKKQIIIDYDEYLELESNNEAHKKNIELLEGKVIVVREYYDNLQQELTDYKERNEKAVKELEEQGIDEKMMENCNIYDVNGIELMKILKGQILDKKEGK